VIEGGKNADVIDGGAGRIPLVLHGDRSDYSVSTNSDIMTMSISAVCRQYGRDGPPRPCGNFLHSTIKPFRSSLPLSHEPGSIQTTRQ